jgi:hypothetical protein
MGHHPAGMAEEGEAPFFYANVMEAKVGAYDFTIDFGYRSPDTGRATTVATIAMSISHAKTMIPVIAKLIAAYEQQFGPVPAPGYEEQSRE